MGYWLRAHTALPEAPMLNGSQPSITPTPVGPMPSSGLCEDGTHTHTHTHK